MSRLVFGLPGNDPFADELAASAAAERGELAIRHFPDGETYVRVDEEVEGRSTVVVATLDRPDGKVLPLWFLAETLRELGADEVGLVAPYLAYMRQDRRFREGEGVTSRYFAAMVSRHVDWLVTVDPHLHRYASLEEIYTVPAEVVHAAPIVADWIGEHVDRPVLIGPDEESEQWVEAIAGRAGAPHVVLEKTRRGDRDVEISVPRLEKWRERTPVVVDDIVSTARTMIETVEHLRDLEFEPAVCIGVHGIFAGDALEELRSLEPRRIATTDTIPHSTNAISVVPAIARAMGPGDEK